MSHTPVPEKMEGTPTHHQSIVRLSPEAQKINDLINWAHSIEKRLEEYAWPKHVTGAVEQSIIDQHVTKALAEKEQPSEVVRPVTHGIEEKTHLNLFEVWATYPTREAAETARKMLLGGS